MATKLRISLKAARVNAGLTQREAAETIGICKETLANYENGKSVPNWDVAERMSKTYGIPIDSIFFGRDSA